MKKSILKLAFMTLMTGTAIVSCKPNTEKVQEAQENVNEAQDDLDEAKRAATAEEWQAFKDETNAKIEANEVRLAELKAKLNKTGNEADAAYQRNIDAIEEKNATLKIKVDNYKNDVNSDWNSFKREFDHDMNELGQAFEDITINNKK
jgi:predicted RNase H-like nuclease (RuvC/YqgF family)